MDRSRLFRKHFILPSEHGAWIWLLGPLLVGVAAGSRLGADLIWLTIASLAAFSLRQPAAIAVKALSGRRPRSQLYPGLLWSTAYLLILIAALLALLAAGHRRLLWLAAPGVPVFVWHLWLVSRRSERDQPGIEIVAAGVLALAAPAAYWVSGGDANLVAASLWVLMWLQSAASIVQVHYRLSLRRSAAALEQERSGSGRVLAYHAASAGASAVAALLNLAPALAPLAFSVPLIDGVLSVARPDPDAPPRAIGLRQLVVSSLFVLLMVVGYVGFAPS